MATKIRYYPAEDITIEFDASRCIHAGECVRGLPEVFDTKRRPWVDATQATADDIADVVHRCPTGALQVRRTDGGEEEPVPGENRIQVVPDGPFYCTGDLAVEMPDGSVRQETRVALCRCGASKNKPFCDNSHRSEDFRAATVAMEDRLKPLGDDDANPSRLTLRLADNGPILLSGPVTVSCSDDSSSTGSKGALCRCGASQNKPYCDGTHKTSGFES